MKTLLTLIFLLLIATTTGTQAAETFKVCEDFDGDGRFGIVEHAIDPDKRQMQELARNVGNYSKCVSSLPFVTGCTENGDLCACEDHDYDGWFSVMSHPLKTNGSMVLRANIGTYTSCMSELYTLFTSPDVQDVCEDRDNDGRFGIVRYALVQDGAWSVVLAPDQGNYQTCNSIRAGAGKCAFGVCTCEDRNRDGRFGLVHYPGRLVTTKVLRGNIGSYEQCVASIR